MRNDFFKLKIFLTPVFFSGHFVACPQLDGTDRSDRTEVRHEGRNDNNALYESCNGEVDIGFFQFLEVL